MAVLELRFLGDFELLKNGRALPLPPSKKTRALLAYLSLQPRRFRREQLCDLLWEVPDDPRGSLRWSLSKIRGLLDDERHERVVADRNSVGIEPVDISIDVSELRAFAGGPLADAAVERLEDAVERYHGQFLEGLEFTRFHDFHAWCLACRTQAQSDRAALLTALVERLAEQPQRALPHARSLVGLFPYEERHRATLVRLLVAARQLDEADEHLGIGLHLLKDVGAASSGALLAARRTPWSEPRPSPASADAPRVAALPAVPTATPRDDGADPMKPATPSGAPPVRPPASPERATRSERSASAKATLLVVDDEPDVREVLEEYFVAHGYAAVGAEHAGAARALAAAQSIDLALVDVHMPGEDGLSLARHLRERYPAIAIVMLTSAGTVVDRIVGLEIGADDYVAKPFDPRELLARVKSVLRRTSIAKRAEGDADPVEANPRVRIGRCLLDVAAHRLADEKGEEVPMSPLEFDLLKALAESPGRVLSRERILNLSERRDWDPFDRSVDLRVMRLRKKVEPDPEHPRYIRTIRNGGYVFVPDGK